MIIDIGDKLNWDVVERATYTAEDILKGIPKKSFLVDAPAVIIGIACPSGRDTWRYAGQFIQYAQAYPTTFNPGFPTITEVARERLYLNRYRFIQLADHEPREFLLTIEFPRWFGDALLELWKYSP